MASNGAGPLSKEALFKAAPRATEDVPFEELGGRTLRIQAVHWFEAAELQSDFNSFVGNDPDNVDAESLANLDSAKLDKWIGKCLLDPDTGDRMFDDAAVERGDVRKVDGKVLMKVFQEIFALMGDTKEAQEKIEGESDPSRDFSSP